LTLDENDIERREKDLLKIVGRHHSLLKRLYPDHRFTLRDLATETRKDAGNLSKLITKLEQIGIVKTEKVQRIRGRPFRYITLNPKWIPVLSAISDATKPVSQIEYNPALINIYLDIIEDNELDEEIRTPAAQSLQDTFTATPQKIIPKHKRLSKILEELLADPSREGEITNIKRTMLKISIPQLVRDEEARSWVKEKVYPNTTNILEEKRPEKTLMWAISILENIATHIPDPIITEEIRNKLREAYFKKTVKRESSVGEELEKAILRLFTQKTEATRELISYLKETRKKRGKEGEEKAAFLLKNIVKYLTRDRKKKLDGPLII